MDPTVSAAIIDAGAQTASAGGGVLGQAIFGARNERWAREDATTAYNRAVEQWNRENEYNSPKAQMQRYIEAGLNPNLIYADGQSGAIGLPTVPQAQSAHNNMTAPDIQTNFLQAKLAEAQIRRLNTQNDNDTRMTDAQITRFAKQNDLSDWECKRAEADIQLTLAKRDEAVQGLENMRAQFDILSEEKKALAFQNAFTEATQSLKIEAANAESTAIAKTAVALAMAEVLNVKADTALKWANVGLAKANTSLAGAQELESRSRSVLNSAQVTVAQEQARLIAAQVRGTDANTEAIMWRIASDKNYAQTVYGSEGEGWFSRSVHLFTGALDCAFKMAGQLVHGTSVVHQ